MLTNDTVSVSSKKSARELFPDNLFERVRKVIEKDNHNHLRELIDQLVASNPNSWLLNN